jgi:hypothetical protein
VDCLCCLPLQLKDYNCLCKCSMLLLFVSTVVLVAKLERFHDVWMLFPLDLPPSQPLHTCTGLPNRLCRAETPAERLEEARAAGESAQVVVLQKHLAKALHSSQLTQVWRSQPQYFGVYICATSCISDADCCYVLPWLCSLLSCCAA